MELRARQDVTMKEATNEPQEPATSLVAVDIVGPMRLQCVATHGTGRTRKLTQFAP